MRAHKKKNWFAYTIYGLLFSMVCLQFFIVYMRNIFLVGSIQLQEVIIYLNAYTIAMSIALCWQNAGHVKIDIFYAKFSEQTQCIIRILGIMLFCLPFVFFCLINSYPYIWASWKIFESSTETNGLPIVYILKTSLMIMPLCLGYSVISSLIYDIQQLRKHRQQKC